MPSGKVHDKITILTAAAVGPCLWLAATPHAPLSAACATAGYLFGGLWMSDDLDTRSVSYKRWGPLRIVWWPYQKLIPHRSWISHGVGIGPLLRVFYFAAAAFLCARLLLGLAAVWIMPLDRDLILRKTVVAILSAASAHADLGWWALGGLIAAGFVHGAADRIVSTAKRLW